tara:strand:- start:41 stop:361 length:321 start_codon:yes stop_codon:yes gene_type:complete
MATWTISQLERNTADGGVIVAHWRVTEEETVGTGDDAVTYTASSYGSSGFTPDPSASDYIAYADLTEADVIGWVEADVDQDAINTALTEKIDEQKNPTTVDGVPWR